MEPLGILLGKLEMRPPLHRMVRRSYPFFPASACCWVRNVHGHAALASRLGEVSTAPYVRTDFDPLSLPR